MNITPEYDTELVAAKVIVAAILMWVLGSLSGCGLALGKGVVLGSTGFLEAARADYAAPLDEYTPEEKRGLNAIIRRKY